MSIFPNKHWKGIRDGNSNTNLLFTAETYLQLRNLTETGGEQTL